MVEKRFLNILGTAGSGQGYSGLIEQLCMAMERRSDTDVYTMQFNKSISENLSPAMKLIKEKPFRLADVGVVMGFPAAADSNRSKFRVLYTMFETDTLPTGKDWAGIFGDAPKMINMACDLLLVPCQHNKEVFRRSGVTIPIEVVPCGVNPELFPYVNRNRTKDHKYTYFMYGTLTLRKNPGAVLSAFATLFRDNPEVRLVLKTQSGTLGHIEYLDMGDIEVIDELWTVERLYEALADADCFVFPSRGEGFGLPPLEAMSTGLPTIIADNTGMSDYANLNYNLPVKTKAEVPAQRFPNKWGNVGNWYEPDYQELKEYMQWCYLNKQEAKEMGDRASDWVQNEWSYDNAAQKLIDVIKKHYSGWKVV